VCAGWLSPAFRARWTGKSPARIRPGGAVTRLECWATVARSARAVTEGPIASRSVTERTTARGTIRKRSIRWWAITEWAALSTTEPTATASKPTTTTETTWATTVTASIGAAGGTTITAPRGRKSGLQAWQSRDWQRPAQHALNPEETCAVCTTGE